MGFRIGCAAVDITPARCYATIDGESSRPIRILDPLYARMMLLDSGDESWLIIALDLIGIQERHGWKIKKQCSSLGICPDNVVITATHTHSAPLTIDFYGMQLTDENYIDLIAEAIQQGLHTAKEDMEPVESGFGQTHCPLNINRMMKNSRRADVSTFDVQPGIVDDTLSVIGFRRPDCSLKAILWHYTAHPFTVWPEHVISPDFPGAVAHVCREKLDCFSLFLQGCAGNSNPRITGGADACAIFSGRIFDCIQSCLENLNYSVSEPYAMKNTVVEMPLFKGGHMPLPVQQLLSSQWSITFLPGEQFSETALEIKKRTGPSHITAAYANKGEIGYVPAERYYTTDIYAYECFESCLYYMTPMKAAGCTKNIVDVCSANIKSALLG